MEIPDNSVGWGIGILGAVVAWLVRLEARLNARPTREEQKEIATAVAAKIESQFTEIKTLLEKQNESTARSREQISAALAEISTQVAVLRDRTGDDPLAESGRRRS